MKHVPFSTYITKHKSDISLYQPAVTEMRSCTHPERVDHLETGDGKKSALGHLQPVKDGSTD